MSFDIFLQRFTQGMGSPGGGEAALRVLTPLLAAPPDDGYGLVRTDDGEADVYGLGADGLMFNHAAGRQVWQVMVDVARAAGYVIMPVGCPTCVTTVDQIADLPDELRGSAIVVNDGDDVLGAVLSA